MPKIKETTDYLVGKYEYHLDLDQTLSIDPAKKQSWARIGPHFKDASNASDQVLLLATSYIIEVQGTDALTRKGACTVGNYQLLYYVEEDGSQWVALFDPVLENFARIEGEAKLADAQCNERKMLHLHRVIKREYANQ